MNLLKLLNPTPKNGTKPGGIWEDKKIKKSLKKVLTKIQKHSKI